MHTYEILGAFYDGTAPDDNNPLVSLHYSVDGVQSWMFRAVFWAGIQQANSIGGSTAVQNYLAPILLSGASKYPPYPLQASIYQSPNIPPPQTGENEVCSEALVGSWTQ